MEDMLKHAFDTIVVGVFALLLYTTAVLACARSPRKWVTEHLVSKSESLARVALVLLPLVYVIGTVSYAAGDGLFNEPRDYIRAPGAPHQPPFAAACDTNGIQLACLAAAPVGIFYQGWPASLRTFSLRGDEEIRASTYLSRRGEACAAAPDGGKPMSDEFPWLCRLRGGVCGPAADSAVADATRLYTYQRYYLRLAESPATELHEIRERLVILRGTGLHGFLLSCLTGWAGLFFLMLAAVGDVAAAIRHRPRAPSGAPEATTADVTRRAHGTPHSVGTRGAAPRWALTLDMLRVRRTLRVGLTLLAVSYGSFLLFASAAGGVSALEEEYDRAVIGLYRAQAAHGGAAAAKEAVAAAKEAAAAAQAAVTAVKEAARGKSATGSAGPD